MNCTFMNISKPYLISTLDKFRGNELFMHLEKLQVEFIEKENNICKININ